MTHCAHILWGDVACSSNFDRASSSHVFSVWLMDFYRISQRLCLDFLKRLVLFCLIFPITDLRLVTIIYLLFPHHENTRFNSGCGRKVHFKERDTLLMFFGCCLEFLWRTVGSLELSRVRLIEHWKSLLDEVNMSEFKVNRHCWNTPLSVVLGQKNSRYPAINLIEAV